jgi:hypothetical protein
VACDEPTVGFEADAVAAAGPPLEAKGLLLTRRAGKAARSQERRAGTQERRAPLNTCDSSWSSKSGSSYSAEGVSRGCGSEKKDMPGTLTAAHARDASLGQQTSEKTQRFTPFSLQVRGLVRELPSMLLELLP